MHHTASTVLDYNNMKTYTSHYKSYVHTLCSRLLLFSILLFTSLVGYAQFPTLEVGFFAGGSSYLGDLNPKNPFNMIGLGYGGVVKYNINDRNAFRVNVLLGTLAGDDNLTKAVEGRNLAFKNEIMEISLQYEISFLPYFTGSHQDFFSPYIFFGLGYLNHSPTAEFEGTTYNLQELNTEGQGSAVYPDRESYSSSQFVVPFGGGVRLALNERIGAGFEVGFRKTFTDYLDDVSMTYYFDGQTVDQSDPVFALSDPTFSHEKGETRGDPQSKDWYAFIGFTLTYRFNLVKHTSCSSFQDEYRRR